MDTLPTIPDETKQNLPPFLRQIISHYDDPYTQDAVLLASIVTLSSVLPNTYYVYRHREYTLNLFFYLTGTTAAGKSVILSCLELVNPIQEQRTRESEMAKAAYDQKLAAYNKSVKTNPDAPMPVEPIDKVLILPAKTTDSRMIQHINNNPDGLLIFESEASVFRSRLVKDDTNNYKATLTKAASNESVSYSYITTNEYVQTGVPSVSVVLSSSYEPLHDIFNGEVEDGFFSRFFFYHLPKGKGWIDETLDMQEVAYSTAFKEYGKRFFQFYNLMFHNKNHKYLMWFNAEQIEMNNNLFRRLETEYGIKDNDSHPLASSHFRHSLHTRSIASILTILRLMPDFDSVSSSDIPLSPEPGSDVVKINCTMQDFQCAISIAEVLFKYIANTLSYVIPGFNPANPATYASASSSTAKSRKPTDKQLKLYDFLPDEPFTPEKADEIFHHLTRTNPSTTKQSYERQFKSLQDKNYISYDPTTNLYSKAPQP